MSTRTVRLDDKTEKTLKQIVKRTGWSVSSALKKGLYLLQEDLAQSPPKSAFEVYQRLDLGPGGYAIVPATEVRRGIQLALRRKARK